MSYKIKTLVVFDTKSLRSTDAGEVAYNFFAHEKTHKRSPDTSKVSGLFVLLPVCGLNGKYSS